MQIDAGSLRALLIKDVRLQWVAFVVLVLFEVVTFVSFQAQFPAPMRAEAATFLQGVTSIGTFVMAYRLLATEESSGSIRFLKSLPLTNDEIYFSKFIFIFLFALLNAIFVNVIYVLGRRLLPWTMNDPSPRAFALGLAVQLVFAVVLVAIATLASSEKAIWVPFPAVILLLNAFTLLTADSQSAGQDLIANVKENWLWWSLGVVVVVVALMLGVINRTRSKRSLVG